MWLWMYEKDKTKYKKRVAGATKPLSFLGLPSPDPLVRSTDPDPNLDPDPSIIKQK